jgi:hypothetical protein
LLSGALLACQPLDDKEWKLWNAQQLVGFANKDGDIVGMPASQLTATAKHGVPFRTRDYEPVAAAYEAEGPTMLPAFAEGGTAAYFVTEAWQNNARPLVQPIYILVSEFEPTGPATKRLAVDGKLVPTIFGVDAFSAFGSPYWQVQYVVPEDASKIGLDTVTDVRKVMQNKKEVHPGALVGCPILPGQVAFVDGRALRPLSFEPVRNLAVGPVAASNGVRNAYAEGRLVDYVDLGPNTFAVDGDGYVVPTRIYYFFTEQGHLRLPAVLAADARRNTLADRIDVRLDSTYEVFVPAGAEWSTVRDALRAAGVRASSSASTDARLRLKVAKRDPTMGDSDSCFDGVRACPTLDSEAGVLANTTAFQRTDPHVRLSVWTMLFNGAIP